MKRTQCATVLSGKSKRGADRIEGHLCAVGQREVPRMVVCKMEKLVLLTIAQVHKSIAAAQA